MTLQERARQRANELDQRYVPLLAARTREGVEQLAAKRRGLAEQKRRLAETKPAELDARYASNRVMRAVRDIPQLGFVVIAAVFLAGTATAVVRHQPVPAPEQVVGEPTPVAGTRLGPEIGETTAGYESTATRDLKQLAERSPTSTRLALVTFAAYQTPSQIESLLGRYQVRRIYVRAKVGGPDAAQLPYDIRGELGASLRRAYADVAQNRLAARQGYLAYVETTKDDKAFQADYAAYAASTGREVIAYQHNCACVFNAVVEAPAQNLLALSASRSVRAIQVAGDHVELAALVVQPLLPETRGLVTKGPVTEEP